MSRPKIADDGVECVSGWMLDGGGRVRTWMCAMGG